MNYVWKEGAEAPETLRLIPPDCTTNVQVPGIVRALAAAAASSGFSGEYWPDVWQDELGTLGEPGGRI